MVCFSSILNSRLDKYRHSKHIINPCQIGFTKQARTSDNVFILKTLTDKYCKSEHEKLYACYVDFHKTFDSINYAALKLKLLRVGVGSRFYCVLKEM